MKYTVAQIRSLTEIPSQTLRIWRDKLPPIQGRNGYKACFTTGDALALKVVRRLTGEIGLPIGRLVPISDKLFSVCQGEHWPTLEKSCLHIDLSNNILQVTPLKEMPSALNVSLLLIPIATEISALRSVLLPEATQQNLQQSLLFPPLPIAGGGAG